MATSNTYENFLIQHLDFAIEYISLHYPFSETQVKDYIPYLIKGEAFYSEYIPELGSIITPEIGLSFNQNIPWTLTLKQLWNVGYQISSPECWSIYGGYYQNGKTHVWGNISPDNLFDMIPLHWYKELLDEESIYENYYNGQGGRFSEVTEDKEYAKLTVTELVKLYNHDRNIVLYNDSIWNNTLKEVLTSDVMEWLIDANKRRLKGELPKQPVHVEFPDFHTYMEQMPPDHDNDPCYGAFNLYEYLWGNSNAGDNKTLNALAQKWETSVKKITEHMGCVHTFLEKSYPDVLRVMKLRDEQEATETEDDDEYEHDDDYFSKEQYHKYNGYNDWPDQAIDEAFEGDPEATWNVD